MHTQSRTLSRSRIHISTARKLHSRTNCTDASMRICDHIDSRKHMHFTHLRTYLHAHTYRRTHTPTHIPTHTHLRTHLHAHTYRRTHTHLRTHLHAHTHTYARSYTPIPIDTHACLWKPCLHLLLNASPSSVTVMNRRPNLFIALRILRTNSPLVWAAKVSECFVYTGSLYIYDIWHAQEGIAKLYIFDFCVANISSWMWTSNWNDFILRYQKIFYHIDNKIPMLFKEYTLKLKTLCNATLIELSIFAFW